MNDELENQPPSDWDMVPIGERFTFTTKPKGLRFDDCETIPFVPMERIPSDRLFFSDFVLRKSQEISSGTYFEEGDLLVSKITPCFENGKQGIATKIPGAFGVATTEVIPIKAKEGVSHLPFLAMYLLDSEVRNSLAGKMEGATGRQRLSKSVLEDWSMPFPPLPEQRAIAAVLSKIQAAVEVQDKMVATLKELKAATMAKLFREGLRGEPLKQTEIGEIPESWELNPLQTLCLKTEIADPTRNPDKSFQYVDVSSVSNDECRIISTTTHNGCTAPSRARKRVMAKDVIFATVRPTLRRVALVSDTLSGHIVSTAFCVLRANPERAVPEFIYYAVLRPEFISSVEGLQRGASYPAVTDGDVLRQLIPVPSIAEQREIALILSRIHEDEQVARGKRDTLRSLFSSMLHLLMTGRVRVKSEIRVAGGVTMAKSNASQEYGQAGPSKNLPEGVKRFVEEVARQFVPERIILFGSYAEGSATPDSDMDLLVVMEFEGRARDQAARIGAFMRRDFPLDLLVRRPEDLRRLIESGDPFFREIVEKGEVLYARSK